MQPHRLQHYVRAAPKKTQRMRLDSRGLGRSSYGPFCGKHSHVYACGCEKVCLFEEMLPWPCKRNAF